MQPVNLFGVLDAAHCGGEGVFVSFPEIDYVPVLVEVAEKPLGVLWSAVQNAA